MQAHELDKQICVERRVDNSPRLHFNRLGDWRPRLVVWPEYNGQSKDEFPKTFGETIDRATDQQWGKIIADTIERFAPELAQQVTAFDSVLPSVWRRLTSQYAAPYWKRNDAIRLDAAYVNCRQDYGHGDPVFLVTPTDSLRSVPERIQAPLLDRTNLLPFGIAILDFGIEEAVMNISFAKHEELFLHTIEHVATSFGHRMVQTDKHFVSHWVIANPTEYGEDWREF